MNENLANQQQAVKTSGKSRRGFASMDKDRHKSVSSKGGKAVRASYSGRAMSPAEVNTSPLN